MTSKMTFSEGSPTLHLVCPLVQRGVGPPWSPVGGKEFSLPKKATEPPVLPRPFKRCDTTLNKTFVHNKTYSLKCSRQGYILYSQSGFYIKNFFNLALNYPQWETKIYAPF